MKKKVAVVGAGFAGVSAAWDILQAGHSVEVFEAEKLPGGLASGLQTKKWSWSAEHHYHHVFKTDADISNLLNEMGLAKNLFFLNVNTRSYFAGKAWSVDSPIGLLKFSPLSFFERLRTGVVLAFLKFLPNGSFLEKYTAKDFLQKTMGKKTWDILWKPLFVGKFGDFVEDINMAWFWARISARSQELGYYEGGFLQLAKDMVHVLEKKGVVFHFSTPIKKIQKKTKKNKKINIILEKNKNKFFDSVLVTAPSTVLEKIITAEKSNLQYLSARTLLLELKKPFFEDKTYWLSIHEKDWPFLAVIEHTNLVNSSNYGKKHLLYIGKYLDKKDPFYKLSKQEVIKKYKPFLNKLSPGFSKNIEKSWVFDADFAQPLVFQNHSKSLPTMTTSINGVFWISIQHIYPWDRGINYAVRFGRKAGNNLNKYF